MKSQSDDSGFTGLEAAIVLIAFVVVAAVFSYVVLGAGFFTTQKSQETVYKGVEQATSNLQVIGNVYGYGTGTTGDMDIQKIQLNVGLAPGAPSLDLTKMIITVSQPGSATISQLTYSTTLGTSTFTVTEAGTSTALPTLSGQKQGTVLIYLPSVLEKNNKINIELRPSVGAALPFTRSAPATLESSQILY